MSAAVFGVCGLKFQNALGRDMRVTNLSPNSDRVRIPLDDGIDDARVGHKIAG
jgi:hypothetical protein